MYKKISETSEYLLQRTQSHAKTAIVLGSGLNGLADVADIHHRIPYAEIPNFPVSTVKGHAGNLLFGTISGVEVMILQGRFHYYEGYDMKTVTFPELVMKFMGIETVILSNAAGGVNPAFKCGEIMLIRDHLNLFPEHPLRGRNDDRLGERFPNMKEVYDRTLIQQAMTVAQELGITCHTGVYAGTQGPSFETPAEYRMFRTMGADCVGMSTVPEAIVAHYAGIRCLAFSVITNVFDENSAKIDTHEEVLEAGVRAGQHLTALIKQLLPKI